LDFEPSSAINIFFGFNAQGKTNLLESIYYLATTHSHRSNKDQELLRWGSQYLHLKGCIFRNNRKLELEINFQESGEKIIKVAGIKKTRLPDYLGSLSVVLFSPEDLKIVKGSPKERRRLLDIEISQISTNYINLLIQYQKTLGQRNNLLKSFKEKRLDIDQLEIWDSQLIKTGSKILAKRFEIIKKLSSLAKINHLKISAGKEKLEIKYLSSFHVKPDFSVEEIENSFNSRLKELRREELNRGSTLIGPHRDDLVFYINNIDVKLFGSQGQQRTTALSIKLAEVDLMYGEIGEYPVLLLDDVLSELDSLRRHYLLSAVRKKVQTFVTTTNLEFIDQELLAEAKIFRIDEGELIPH